MGNTLAKQKAGDEASSLMLESANNDNPINDNNDEDDWFSTSSMGSSSEFRTVTAAEPPQQPTNTNQFVSKELNHGVLALKQAQQQQAASQHPCFPALWWWKPQQPLWVDIRSSPSDQGSQREEDIVGKDEEEEVEHPPSPLAHNQGLCNYRYYSSSPTAAAGASSSSWMMTPSHHLSSCSSSLTSSSSSHHSSSSYSSWFVDELEYTPHELTLSSTEPTQVSDLSKPRHVWIVTTAALPWFTGTAVNPLLRAASLWQRYQSMVEDNNDKLSFSITLVLPWLHRATDRVALYGAEWEHKTVQDQEAFIRNWLATRAQMPGAAQHVQIQWYASHYHTSLSSIFAVDDVCDACHSVPSNNAVCVLEEPEHLSIYRAPGKTSWGQKFCHVIGIIHTNYKAYCRSHASGLVTGPLVGALFASLVRAYCDQVIKLSDVLQNYAPEKQVTSNVHGIRQEFLQVAGPQAGSHKCYFIGKLLFAKGLDKMLTLQQSYKKATGDYFALDVYGSGPEQEEIQQAFLGTKRRRSSGSDNEAQDPDEAKMPVQFLGRVDHASVSNEYKIFINPSITEVLCTTTAEALAMGKFVIIPHHSSNHFFSQFPNCLQYHSKYEFCVLLKYALTNTPTPLSDAHRHTLTWEAATDRFFQASAVSLRDAARRERISGRQGDERLANLHEDLCKGGTGVVVRTILHNGDDPLKPDPSSSTSTRSPSAAKPKTLSSWFPRPYKTLKASGRP